jgi:hypothetical protein
MRALSLSDPAAGASDRADHGPLGSYDGWPARSAVALAELGFAGDAVAFLAAAAGVLDEGALGQAHRLFLDDVPSKAGGDGGQDTLESVGGSFAEAALLLLAKLAPAVGADSPLPPTTAVAAPPLRAPAAAAPTFSVALALGSRMVLQRAPAVARVWGFDAPGTTVTATLSDDPTPHIVRAGADGVWRVALPPHEASGPFTLSISSSSGGNATLEDLYFGLVFLCGGQSNASG